LLPLLAIAGNRAGSVIQQGVFFLWWACAKRRKLTVYAMAVPWSSSSHLFTQVKTAVNDHRREGSGLRDKKPGAVSLGDAHTEDDVPEL
jgi:hypothetical protein